MTSHGPIPQDNASGFLPLSWSDTTELELTSSFSNIHSFPQVPRFRRERKERGAERGALLDRGG